jgi:hypothetical protein
VTLSLDGSRSGNKENRENNKRTFIENLRTHGWSPIVVSKAPSPSPSQEEILSIFGRRRRLQKQEQIGTNSKLESGRDVVFIAAESGSSEGTIEPKESLEVQLSKCGGCVETNKLLRGNDDDDDDNRDEVTVKTWCRTLSWIAHKICGLVLDMPENLFLPVDPNESLDLLRVFHYYAVLAETAEGSSQPTLGSSEHTDWGSLTVVWQDSVGGLQTYCRKCKKWINVGAATTNETTTNRLRHRWECIVHVGDMASLVLDRSCNSENPSNDINTNTSDMISHPWPSPRHRVQSHPHKERVSLVYFGYPPRGLSLDRIQKEFDAGWPHSSTRGRRLPLGDYYLLRNQSATVGTADDDDDNCDDESYSRNLVDGDEINDNNNNESNQLYRTMWNIPIRDIVRLKWEQVNRSEEPSNGIENN